MNDTVRFQGKFWIQLVYIFLLPLFFISFCLVYNPFGIQDFYQMVGGKGFAFHLVILSCIQLLILFITRLLLYFISRGGMKWWAYAVWCFGECLVISLFTAMYTSLFFGSSLAYFPALSLSLKFIFLSLIYPYLTLSLIRLSINLNEDKRMESEKKDEHSTKFFDEHNRLKLTVLSKDVLYVKSDINNIIIHYLDNGREKEFTVRCPMKRVESNPGTAFLKRCHRSYLLNPSHVRVLGKNKEGVIIAELDNSPETCIPVGKQYYEALSQMIL